MFSCSWRTEWPARLMLDTPPNLTPGATMHRVAITLALVVATVSIPAQAIPAFARKYGTSCTTCHTVFPKLTPFGESFRRNGYRFPGVDSDYVKQEVVTLTPKAQGVEDYVMAAIPPLSFGFNGQMVFHPDRNSSGGIADNGAVVIGKDLVQEGHVWTGGSFSDTITYFGEITFANDGTIAVEHAQLHLNDLVGPKHAVNLRIGRGYSSLTSFSPHSSYLNDQIMPSSGLTGLNGAGTSWNVFDKFNGLEATGVVGGRFGYSLGLNAGNSFDIRSMENFYGHVGFKVGGMALDGEGESTVKDAMRPWEETALTIDLWGYRAISSANYTVAAADDTKLLDSATVGGVNLRLQFDSLELNAGGSYESHTHVTPDPMGATLGFGGSLVQTYAELSYLVQPWFVPAVRFEYTSASSQAPGVDSVYDVRLTAGIASAILETANGTPPGGWGEVGGVAAASVPVELENVQLFAAFTF
jgi:hypothetical protein